MADNTTLNTGSGGDTLATDDIGGVKYPRGKIVIGADGTNDGDVSSANPLPTSHRSEFVDDAAFTPGTSRVTVIAAQADETGPDSVDEGDAGALRMTLPRALHVNPRNASGTEIGTTTTPFAVQGSSADGSSTIPNPILIAGRAASEPETVNVPVVGAVTVLAESLDLMGTHDPSLGACADAAASTDTGTFSLIALFKRLLSKITTQLPAALAANGGLKVEGVAGGVAVPVSLDVTHTDDAAFTPGTGKVAAVGFLVDGTATDSADEGDIGIARMTADRAQIAVATERSGTVYESDVALPVKRAVIDAATSGDNTLVAAVTGKKVRVLSVFMVAASAVNVRFESGASGTALTGQMNLAANGGFVLPHNPHGWFETADATLLNLELSGAVSVDGSLTYIEAE